MIRLQRHKHEDPCVMCVQSEIARFCNERQLSRGTYSPYAGGGGGKLGVAWGVPPDAIWHGTAVDDVMTVLIWILEVENERWLRKLACNDV